ncbi:hypothetical protein JCM1393_26760 [Clostridium carnis]
MKKIKFSILVITILIIGSISFFIISKERIKNHNEKHTDNIYNLEKSKTKFINKTLKGHYLSPLITVVEENPTFTITLDNIKPDSNVTLINSFTGKMVELNSSSDGTFTLDTPLDKDIEYGLLIDFMLAGSIRVVDDLNNINEKELHDEILKNLQCGL